MTEQPYDLGIITRLSASIAYGLVIGTNEKFSIKFNPEVADSLIENMVVAINQEHTDFIYKE